MTKGEKCSIRGVCSWFQLGEISRPRFSFVLVVFIWLEILLFTCFRGVVVSYLVYVRDYLLYGIYLCLCWYILWSMIKLLYVSLTFSAHHTCMWSRHRVGFYYVDRMPWQCGSRGSLICVCLMHNQAFFFLHIYRGSSFDQLLSHGCLLKMYPVCHVLTILSSMHQKGGDWKCKYHLDYILVWWQCG